MTVTKNSEKQAIKPSSITIHKSDQNVDEASDADQESRLILRRSIYRAGKKVRRSLPVIIGWVLVVWVCYALGNLARYSGVPAPDLLVSLVFGCIASLTGLIRSKVPRSANRASQALVGVLMGSYLDPASVKGVMDYIGPLSLITLATVALSIAMALVMPRIASIWHAESILGMVPGGSAAIVSCADELNADSRLVALMQYLRVALVAATAPAVILLIDPTGNPDDVDSNEPLPSLYDIFVGSTQLVEGARPVAGLTILIALCFLGYNTGRRLSFPAPALLGPMLLAGVGVFTGAAGGFAPTGLLKDVVFVLVGLEVGLRFSPASLRRAGRSLPSILIMTFAICLACAVLAGGLSLVTGLPYMDAYLATTPGGINAVLATAGSMHLNVALISTAQSIRLFAIVLFIPPFIRWLSKTKWLSNINSELLPLETKAEVTVAR